jgi:hypothetical protein
MTVTLILETGQIVSGANSYADRTFADAFLDRNIYADGWVAATTADKEACLVWATQLLDDGVVWVGQRVSESQALGWPRYQVWDRDGYAIASNVVPTQVQRATSELARLLLLSDRTAEAETLGYSELEAGPLRIAFDRRDQQKPVLTASVLSMLHGLIEGDTAGRVRFARLART